MLVLRELGLARELPDDNEKLVLLGLGRGKVVAEREEDIKKGTLKDRVKKKTKEILIDDELRRRRFVPLSVIAGDGSLTFRVWNRVQKMTMIAEGAEASRVEEAVEKRKRKVEDDKRWEGQSTPSTFAVQNRRRRALTRCSVDTREDRVTDWRSFQKGPKKKKNKSHVLG